MVRVKRMLTQEDLRRAAPVSKADLSEYTAQIDEIVNSEHLGAELELEPEEQQEQRAIKRRYSVAAKQLGYDLTWRQAPKGELRFVLARLGEKAPGGRGPRKTKASGVDGS